MMNTQEQEPIGHRPTDVKPRRRSPVSILFFAISASVSVLIFGIAAATSLSSLDDDAAMEVGETGDRVAAASLNTSDVSAEDYRSQARQLDQQFLQRHRQSQPPRTELTSARDARRHWELQVMELHAQLKNIQSFPEGSIAWHRRRTLERLLQDPPLPPAQSAANPAR